MDLLRAPLPAAGRRDAARVERGGDCRKDFAPAARASRIAGATLSAKASALPTLALLAISRASASRGLPSVWPRALAAASASRVRREMSARSRSAKAA